jgi:hypothetical protein
MTKSPRRKDRIAAVRLAVQTGGAGIALMAVPSDTVQFNLHSL